MLTEKAVVTNYNRNWVEDFKIIPYRYNRNGTIALNVSGWIKKDISENFLVRNSLLKKILFYF